MGNFNVGTNGGDIICRNNSLLLQDNCYYFSDWNVDIPRGVKKTNSTDYKNGALCYLLNGNRKDGDMAWYQTLDRDPYPVPDANHLPVYLWHDGTYHNDDETSLTPALSQREGEQAVYDLSGRKIANGQRPIAKGLYIVNGKKKIVR
jgi:hypothetical protein